MRRAWLLLTALAVSGQPAQEIRLLVKGSPASAAMDHTTFRVLSIEPAKTTKAVVILDLAATPLEDHACLALELSGAMEHLGRTPIYGTGGTRGDIFYLAEMSTGLQLGLLSKTQQLTEICEKSRAIPPPKPVPRLQTQFTHDFLRALASAYAGQGPLRVFWISGDFAPYDWRTAVRRPMARSIRGSSMLEWPMPALPSIVEYLAEPFSAASITFFPLLVSRGRNDYAADSAARYLADATGGFAALATERPGEGLLKLIAHSENLSIARLAGPEIPAGWNSSLAGQLRLRAEDGTNLLDRAWVYPAARADEKARPEKWATRLVAFDSSLSFATGCPTPPEPGLFLQLRIPEVVASAPAPLLVHVQYLRPGKPTLRQRMALKRPAPLCVPITDDGPGNSFIVVAHDEATGWTGARRATLSAKKAP